MSTVVHLSDLHFGRTDPRVVAALEDTVTRLAPSVVVVSGDLTQRARTAQFAEAQRFLASLPCPQVVVPGNHDVPLYNIAARLARPLARYRRLVTPNLQPHVVREDLAVFGLNTTRSWTVKGGLARPMDVRRVSDALRGLDESVVKIVVAHHPFGVTSADAPLAEHGPHDAAMAALTEAGADVFLTGHLHVSYAGRRAARFQAGGRTAIVLGAGTATSTRVRGEPNAFNVLRVNESRIAIERFDWSAPAAAFRPQPPIAFERTLSGWSATATAPTLVTNPLAPARP
jgi:3',5'-cyclic AMP phosphodiesterase CpdA